MADAEATRFDSKDKGVSYYKQALATEKLGPADELYVKAVLSEDVFEAIKFAEAAIKLDPFRKDANEFLVPLYAMSGQRQKLIEHVQVLKGSFPEDANYVFLEALLLVLDDRLEEAHKLLTSLKGRIADAESSYRRALAINPGSAEAAGNLAQILIEAGRPGEAVPWLVQALCSPVSTSPALT